MNIEETAQRITELKEREDAAKNERTALENELAAAIATKEEGTESRTAGSYKITVTSKLNRTLDYPSYQAIEADLPEGVRCVKFEPKLDLKKLRAMDLVRPGFSAQFITTKPAKASVKVEVL